MSILLNEQQLSKIKEYIIPSELNGFKSDYVGMYAYIHREFKDQMEPEQAYWFQQAAEINRYLNNPTIEIPTQSGYFIQQVNKISGKTDSEIAEITNQIAKNVYNDIIDNGRIPDLSPQVNLDIKAALDAGNLNVSQWGGAFYYWDLQLESTDNKKLGVYIVEKGLEQQFIDITSTAMAATIDKFRDLTSEASIAALEGAISTFAIGNSYALNPIYFLSLPLSSLAFITGDQVIGAKIAWATLQKSEFLSEIFVENSKDLDLQQLSFDDLRDYLEDYRELLEFEGKDPTITVGISLSRIFFDDVILGTGANEDLDGGLLIGLGNDTIYGLNGNDKLEGGIGNDTLIGGKGNDELYGGWGNDRLYGGVGTDQLFGGDDHDKLIGMNGIDYLYGGNGNDVLLGGAENDELHGGDGNDYLNGGSEVDLLDGGNGNDVLVGGAGWLQAEGGDGNDIIYADQNNINLLPDDLNGGAGNDIIYAGMGQATIKGGYGNDLIYGGNSNDIIEGGPGVNILQGGAGTDNFKFYTSPVLGAYETTLIKDTNGIITINGTQLEVGGYNQDIKAWYSADNQYIIKKIEGDAGQTLISIYQKDDNKTIIYVDGWNTNGDMGLTFSEIPPQTIPSTENLPLINDGNNIAYQKNMVNAGGGNDYVEGTLGNDIIKGGNGNNFINGLEGDDILEGGDDQDIIFGAVGKDTIYGGGGGDLILSSANNTITSGYFASKLHAHVYNIEELENKIANNSVDSFDINFIYDAKYSDDSQSYTYYFRKDGIVTPILLPDIQFQLIANGDQSSLYSVFSLLETDDGGATGSDQVHGGAGDDFILGSGDADQLYGELDADYLYGRGGDDDLYGGQGQDHIYGGSGRDHINGGTENDLLVGGYEADVIFGGDGVDVILGDLPNYIGTDAPPASADTSRYGDDLIYGGKGGDTLRGNGGNDIIHGENDGDFIFGEEGSDILYGGQGKDNIDGGDGEDILFGGTEDDKLYGKAKSDTLFGGSGIDHLYGGEDDDLLYGDSGNDLLYGGAGSDLYIFSIGDGQDTVIEQLSDIASLNYQNFIYFTFDPSQIKSVIRDEFNLVVRYGTDDQITVRDYYKVRNTSNHSYLENQELFEQIEISELRFEDGTIWDTAKIMELAPPPEVNELPLEARDDVAYFVDALASRDTIAVQGKTTITYSFPINSASGSQPFYLEQMNAIEQALGKFAELLNISFVRSETGAGDLKFYLDDLTEVDAGAAAGYASATSGQVHLNSAYFNTSASLNEGQYGFEVLLHEIGHAMGLEHPFEAPVLPELENNQNNTIMSYTHNGENDTELKIYDMAALHYLHGVNLNIRSENNTYGFADKYIWDGSGIDTFDASEQTQNVFIDLNSGGWSYIGQKSQSILTQGQNFIGYGTTIENAIGGSANDILISNEVNNVLQGRTGQDTYIFNENFGYDEIIETDSENIIKFDFEMDERFLFYRDGAIHYQNNTLKVDLDKITSFEMNKKIYTREEFKAQFLAVDRIYWGTETADTIQVQVGNNKIYGEAGDDQLFGGIGNDQIYGGVGKDYLVGGQGDDVLDGGSENDILDGGYGINTFVFGRGYGNDWIRYAGENNKIKLIDLNPEDIILKMESDRLIIKVKDSNDSLLLEHYFYTFYQYSRPIGKQYIEFENGIIWYQEDIKEALLTPTEQDDLIEGFLDEQHILSGLGGNDQLYGANESDQLFGGNGNDDLYGDSGDDILVGGSGYDDLYGGPGSDTYIFSRGDGRDSLDDKRSSSSTILYYFNGQPVYAPEDYTTLVFTDVMFSDLEFVRKDYGGAEIFIKDTNDSIYIPNFFESSGRYQISKIILQQENLELSLADYIDEFNKPTNRDDMININNQSSSISLDLLLGNDYISLTDSSNMTIYGGQGKDHFSLSNSSN